MSKRLIRSVLGLYCLTAAYTAAQALTAKPALPVADPVTRTFCVFDVVGKHGENYAIMQDYQIVALEWGVDLRLKVYTDERIAAEDFRAGLCDGVSVTGLRGRGFNSFTGTLDSIGSIPTYRHLQVAIGMLSSPAMSRFMRESEFEVAGILPGGAAYLFVNDRSIDSAADLLGKRIAVLDSDASQSVMVASLGASPVTASIATLGPLFNNGAVDVIAAPALAYEPLELYKGLGDSGAIGREAVGQLTFQLIIRWEDFPAGFGQRSRTYIHTQYERVMALIGQRTTAIPESAWLDIPDGDREAYNEMFRQTRLRLRNEGFYNGLMLKFLARVRCKLDPTLTECTAPDRE